MEYPNYVGVRFKNVGKVYFFSTDLELEKKDKVVVETIRGLELGEIVTDLKPMETLTLETELKPILRKATDEDVDNFNKNIDKAKESFEICKDI